MRGRGEMRFGGMGRGPLGPRRMVRRPLFRPYMRPYPRRMFGRWGLGGGWLPLLGLGALGLGAFLLISVFF